MYYVYAHVDPKTEEVLYIGKGTDSRAWCIQSRGPGHQEYLESFVRDHGRGSYVRIIFDHLDESEALILEKGLICMNQPSLNVRRAPLVDEDPLDYKEAKSSNEVLWRPPVI